MTALNSLLLKTSFKVVRFWSFFYEIIPHDVEDTTTIWFQGWFPISVKNLIHYTSEYSLSLKLVFDTLGHIDEYSKH